MAETEQRMNLQAIQRSDPYAKEIINSSAHVAFYTYNKKLNEWEKTDIEGALFIYSRTAEPHHSIFINNRLNTNSLIEPINEYIELQSQPPFLLYRNERSRIRGFWFYNKLECDRIRKIIAKLVADCEEAEKPGDMGKVPANGNNAVKNVDIFTMLTKAQEDFNNSAAKQQSVAQQEQLVSRNPTAAMVVAPDQSTPQSVVNFFAAAKQPVAAEVPLLQTLMSNPVHTVEQIEKQHRATTPQKEITITGKITPEVNDLEASFKLMGIPITTGPPPPPQELGTSPLATFLSSTNLAAVRPNNQPILKAKAIEISELESRQQQQQQQQQPLHELLKKTDPMNNSLNSTPATLNTTASSGSATKPALMPPTMFATTSTAKGLSDLFANAASIKQQEQGNGTNSTSVTDLLSKANNNHHPPPPGFFPIVGTVEPLTQAQLIQALTYLIKYDADFVRKLHEAYLNSLREMMNL